LSVINSEKEGQEQPQEVNAEKILFSKSATRQRRVETQNAGIFPISC
jgi:hypothetical protein